MKSATIMTSWHCFLPCRSASSAGARMRAQYQGLFPNEHIPWQIDDGVHQKWVWGKGMVLRQKNELISRAPWNSGGFFWFGRGSTSWLADFPMLLGLSPWFLEEQAVFSDEVSVVSHQNQSAAHKLTTALRIFSNRFSSNTPSIFTIRMHASTQFVNPTIPYGRQQINFARSSTVTS